MLSRSFLVGIVVAIMGLPVAAADARQILIDGVALQLAVPGGYCELDPANSEDARVIDVADDIPSREIILYFMRCDALEERRNGQVSYDQHFGRVSVALDGEDAARVHVSRAFYISSVAALTPPIDGDRAKEFALTGKSRDQPIRVSGLLQIDENAAYSGEITTGRHLYIVAQTTVLNLEILVELFETGDSRGFERPMSILRAYMARLIEQNP